jgi:hypothetical protein
MVKVYEKVPQSSVMPVTSNLILMRVPAKQIGGLAA